MSASRFQIAARRALTARNVMTKRSDVAVNADVAKLDSLAKGDWKGLSIAEKQALYRHDYSVTRAEAGASTPGEKQFVIGGIFAVMAVSAVIFQGVRTLTGNPLPHTHSKEWTDATKEKLIAQNANPISGISSKQQK
ncbi:cytochrome c oxidase subunit IV [Sphaeroforma arctica JP610]|uniref:Cytochrome c oxidase subunit IV n=1 Tax=Sphaeroforma arctica JP610 TaxID=667725 RepID=A0A0L0GEJ6_9EUKA|nr:cytochrome c oxidase subunit IV [Sphaeroforma arctica JP610]KNC86663.1 cytochrome c oxidase subunit IV [Sphaeroforma arctica JP610]|eukprot:XP_014160565.1 cytochrome c oxidase subunit IV [Sphaeroforma arctica JP610]